MNEFTKLAISNAIKTEKASHDFYRLAADKAVNPETRELFKRLACDEFEHMSGFIRLYPGGEGEYADLLRGASGCETHCRRTLLDDVGDVGDMGTREALAIAIKEEQSCIEQYSILVDAIRDPEMHEMFCRALRETEKHLEAIESEYARSKAMASSLENPI